MNSGSVMLYAGGIYEQWFCYAPRWKAFRGSGSALRHTCGIYGHWLFYAPRWGHLGTVVLFSATLGGV